MRTFFLLPGSKATRRSIRSAFPCSPVTPGGALADGSGAVVGVIQSKIMSMNYYFRTGHLPENINYAVKASHLWELVREHPEIAKGVSEAAAPVDGVAFQQAVEKVEGATVRITGWRTPTPLKQSTQRF